MAAKDLMVSLALNNIMSSSKSLGGANIELSHPPSRDWHLLTCRWHGSRW